MERWLKTRRTISGPRWTYCGPEMSGFLPELLCTPWISCGPASYFASDNDNGIAHFPFQAGNTLLCDTHLHNNIDIFLVTHLFISKILNVKSRNSEFIFSHFIIYSPRKPEKYLEFDVRKAVFTLNKKLNEWGCGSPPGVIVADTLSFNAKMDLVDFWV